MNIATPQFCFKPLTLNRNLNRIITNDLFYLGISVLLSLIDIPGIQDLPAAIGQLKSMTHLNVDRNRLKRLPVEVLF